MSCRASTFFAQEASNKQDAGVVSCLRISGALAREAPYPVEGIANKDGLDMMKQESIPLLFPEEIHYSTNRV